MTLESMKKFGDRHVPRDKLKHKIYVHKQDASARREPSGRGRKGVLNDRLIDLI